MRMDGWMMLNKLCSRQEMDRWYLIVVHEEHVQAGSEEQVGLCWCCSAVASCASY